MRFNAEPAGHGAAHTMVGEMRTTRVDIWLSYAADA
jgi:hypothetical protein